MYLKEVYRNLVEALSKYDTQWRASWESIFKIVVLFSKKHSFVQNLFRGSYLRGNACNSLFGVYFLAPAEILL